MDWKDKYQQASFREVSFFVSRTQNTGGRRNVVHQFPEKDQGFIEDLGRSLRRFTIEGYILEADYFNARNRLITALEAGGEGELIYPYFGALQVSLDTYEVREATAHGRQALFSMSFREAGSSTFPVTEIETSSNIVFTADAYRKLATDAFLAAYSIIRKPAAILQNIERTLGNAAGLVESARRIVSSNAGFRRDLLAFTSNVSQLVFQAESLSDELTNLLNFGTDFRSSIFPATPENSIPQFNELTNFFDFAPDTDLGVDDPSVVVSNLTQHISTITASQTVAVMPFESVNQAEEIQTLILNQIDAISSVLDVDDGLFGSLRDLRAAIVLHVEEEQTNLSRLVEFVPPVTMPSLYIANSLYGTIDQEADIVARNSIQHPAFVPGNVPIEVLINE